jgi:hypothetical protein
MAAQSLPVDVGDEPLIGWRCWHVLPHEGLLRPIYKRGLVWKPRETLEAICPEEPHEVPAEQCRCGVWTVCHPMLLDEVGWTKVAPQGVSTLPGVIVVGEVSLWGKIIQHERGWRASCAYPRHLYAFTEDAMLAETLRERYGVPVEWGADAERLRRMLPQQAPKDGAGPSLRETLLDVLRAGLCPKPLEELAANAVDAWSNLLEPPAERIEAARRGPRHGHDRRWPWPGWRSAVAAADARALEGDTTAARRALWVRLGRWQRHRCEVLHHKIERELKARDGLLEDLARGMIAKGQWRAGKPYARTTISSKRCLLKILDDQISGFATEIEALQAVPIPTYREWCAIARGSRRPLGKVGEAERAWARRAMRREQELAALDRDLAIRRHQLDVATEALARDRAQLDADRKTLRESVVAGVQRDHAELLREVGDLEARRRAALAMLPGPWPPPDPQPIAAHPRPHAVGVAYQSLAARLRDRGITHQRVAEEAGVGRSLVSHVLAGRAQSQNVVDAAERLLQR